MRGFPYAALYRNHYSINHNTDFINLERTKNPHLFISRKDCKRMKNVAILGRGTRGAYTAQVLKPRVETITLYDPDEAKMSEAIRQRM